ncbi:Protein 21.1 [Giardia lamblia P15]|uniref:Protein 21.1 n=1 Tax=Giardia intestinalis (strain P15) TaxID=658858 RepID=E1F9B2_GIAIA|nr:Protein 21.1 [Giardia lamblia P15]
MQISSVDDWFIAIERGDWATVESNIEVFHGSRNMMHETGLMCAARKDFVDVVRVLMEHEAKLRDHNGYTALMFACENNAADSAKLLLSVEKHIFLFDGRTALHIACESNSNACVELLARELGSVRDKHGRSSLFSAAEVGNTTAISMLLLVVSFSKKEIQQAKSTLKSLGIPSDELFFDEHAALNSNGCTDTSGSHQCQYEQLLSTQDTHKDVVSDGGPSIEDVVETPDPIIQLKTELKRKTAVIEQLNEEVEAMRAQLHNAQQLVKQKNAEVEAQNIAGDVSNSMSLYRFLSLTPAVARINLTTELSNVLVAVPTASLPQRMVTTDVMWTSDVQHLLDAKAQELAMLYDVLTILSGLFLEVDEDLAKDLLLLCHSSRSVSTTYSLYDGNIRLDGVLTCLPDTERFSGSSPFLFQPLLKGIKEKTKTIGKISSVLMKKVQSILWKEQELVSQVEYLEEERSSLLDKLVEARAVGCAGYLETNAGLTADEAIQVSCNDGLLDSIKTLLSDHKILLPYPQWDELHLEQSTTTLEGITSTNASMMGVDQSMSGTTFLTHDPGATSFTASYTTAARQTIQKNYAAYVRNLEKNIAKVTAQLAILHHNMQSSDSPTDFGPLLTVSERPSGLAQRPKIATIDRSTSPVAEFEHKGLMLENKRLNSIIDELKLALNNVPLEANETEEEYFERQLRRLSSLPHSQATGKGIMVGPQTIEYLRRKLLADMQPAGPASHMPMQRTPSQSVPFIGSMDPDAARLHTSYVKLAQPVDVLLDDLLSNNRPLLEASAKAEIARKDYLHLTSGLLPSATGIEPPSTSLEDVSSHSPTLSGGVELAKRSATLTPLMVAIYSKSLLDVERYLDYAGQAKLDGTTALMLAVEVGFTEAVRVLRNKEGRFVRDDGVTALKLAKDTGHNEIIALLSQKPDDDTSDNSTTIKDMRLDLHEAARNFQIDELQRLAIPLAKTRDHKGRTALMIAASIGNYAAVETLLQLESGLQDACGTTALMLAAEQGHLDCVRLLSPHEKDIHDNSGYDALFYMARSKVCIPPEILRKMQEYLL